MRFNFRKIASTITSTLMVGSTVALAAAANYPAPFVQNGNADVAIVYGSNAASTDLVAAADIAANLGTALTSQGGTPVASIEGESYSLFGSGDSQIYHNDSLNAQRTTVTDSNMPLTLADTDFSGNVDSDLTHILRIGSNPRLVYLDQPTSDDDPQWGLSFSTTATNAIYNASVSFDTAVNFSHADSEGESFTMFGQEFTVGSATDGTDLVLFRAAETLRLDSVDNPSQTVLIDDKTYTVELVRATDTSAIVRLTDSNGNSDEKEINEAASKKVLGVEVAVNNADDSETLGIYAEVVVGANKVTLTSGNEVLLGTDETSIDGTKVTFTGGTGAMTRLEVEVAAQDSDEDALLPGQSFVDPVFGSFQLVFSKLVGDDDREMITVQNSGDDKMDVKFTNWQSAEKSVNFVYNVTSSQKTSLYLPYTGALLADSSGDIFVINEMGQVNKSQYTVLGNEDEGVLLEVKTITNSSSGYDSDKVTFENVFTGTTHDVSISSEGSGTVSIAGNDYTVTYFGSASADANTRYVRINDPDSTGNNVNLFNTIETSNGAKVAFYQPIKLALNNWDGSGTDLANVSNLRIPDGDGYSTIAITSHQSGGPGNYTIGGTAINTAQTAGANSTTASIGRFTFNVTSSGTAGTVNIYLTDPEDRGNYNVPGLLILEEEDDNNNYEGMFVQLEGGSTSADGLGVNDVDRTNIGSVSSFITHDSNTDLSSAVTLWGTELTIDAGESDQKTLEISYPNEQISAEVYVAGVDATTSNPGSNLGSVSVMDSEVSQVSSKNLIVIGGSCVNTVAASLLGSDRPLCGADFEQRAVGAGSFLIQSFQSPYSGSKIAVLVAGYNAADTTNAATALRTQSIDTTVGKKYTGNSATSVTLQ